MATNRNTYEKHRREMEKKRKAADKRKRKELKKAGELPVQPPRDELDRPDESNSGGNGAQ